MSDATQMDVLNSLAALKRKDEKAFHKLMDKLNVDRWQDIKANDYGPVVMQAKAIIGNAKVTPPEMLAALGGASTGNLQADLNKMAAHHYGDADTETAEAMKSVINGAPSLVEGFNRVAAAINARGGMKTAAAE